jgi:rubrerythrin
MSFVGKGEKHMDLSKKDWNIDVKRKKLLELEWNAVRNLSVDLWSEETIRSKKYWWICSECGYEWEATLLKRIGSATKKGTGCPFCSGKVLILGKNDLASVAPDLLNEWDYSNNVEFSPNRIYAGSGKKAWWICRKCNNNWQSTISHRVNGRGCPKCGAQNRKKSWSSTCARKNSIAVNRPDALKMWDYEKNSQNGIDPYQVSCTSEKVVFWKCDVCGFEWSRKPNLMDKRYIYCPSCNKRGTSFPEQAIFYYVKKVFPDAINRFKGFEKELDIYIPSANIAIEYDGFAWHKDLNSLEIDNLKDSMCLQKNIKLFRFRDYELKPTKSAFIINFTEKGNIGLNKAIYALLTIIASDKEMPLISIENDYDVINSQLRNAHGKNNLLDMYPLLADEWHPTKNNELLPYHVQPGSLRKVWWKCKKCGHEWKTTLNNRTVHNSGCPACASNVLVKGTNDLKTWCIENDKHILIDEWHFTRNQQEGLDIESVARASNKKAWWICKDCGNIWKAVISSRTTNGHGCGICGRKRAADKRKKNVFDLL